MNSSEIFLEAPTTQKRSDHARAFFSLALIVLVVASVFTIASTSNSHKAIPTPVNAASSDMGGSSAGGEAWCQSQAWADKIIQDRYNYGSLYRLGEWLDWTLRMGSKICAERPKNPIISINCAAPEITIALMVDRSSSVVADGTSATPELYAKSVNAVIDEFYNRFIPRKGKINFLIYAFATKSVMQNATINNQIPTLANIVTDASTPAARAAMVQVITDIHFRDDDQAAFLNKNSPNADRSGFQHDGTQYGKQRAYNLGSENKPGVYGKTNWQDAFINVMDDAASSKYNNATIGKHVDLAVMLTDGLPTSDDGSDWSWTAGTFQGTDKVSYDPTKDAVDYENVDDVNTWNDNYDQTDDLYRITTDAGGRENAKSAVDLLRTGEDPHEISTNIRSIAKRPAMAVRGIIVTTNKDQTVQSKSNAYASDVFGPGNYYFATNFTTALQSQIASMATDVIEASSCPDLNNPVKPILTITRDDSSNPVVRPVEGGTGVTVAFTVTNGTADKGIIKNVYVCLGSYDVKRTDNHSCDGTVVANWDSITGVGGDNTRSFNYTFTVPFGGDISAVGIPFVVYGESDASDEDLAAGGGSRFPVSEPVTVPVEPVPLKLPS